MLIGRTHPASISCWPAAWVKWTPLPHTVNKHAATSQTCVQVFYNLKGDSSRVTEVPALPQCVSAASL